MLQECEWELMSVVLRVEKFKNLQNKACLPSLCYLMHPGYFGGDFLTLLLWELSTRKKISRQYPRAKNVGNHQQSTQGTSNNKEEKVGKLYFANS